MDVQFRHISLLQILHKMFTTATSQLVKSSLSKFRPLRKSFLSVRHFSNDHDHSHDHDHHDHNGVNEELVNINWIRRDGSKFVTPAKLGANLLRVAQKYELEIEGACEGVCACSTCHCIMEPKVYDSLPEPSETEEDMLDQAFGLTPTSRLGCQVIVTKELEGITIKLPKATRNFYVVSNI